MKKIFEQLLESYEYRINIKKYWKRRLAIQNREGLLKKYYLIWIKRQESKFSATTGTGLGTKDSPCCQFKEPIFIPHGLSGIVLARNVVFTGKTTIYQHVTIAEADKEKITYIGDNVEIGAGAVILNNSRIGNNVKIGANAVVVHEVPDNCTVVGIPAKIINKH